MNYSSEVYTSLEVTNGSSKKDFGNHDSEGNMYVLGRTNLEKGNKMTINQENIMAYLANLHLTIKVKYNISLFWF